MAEAIRGYFVHLSRFTHGSVPAVAAAACITLAGACARAPRLALPDRGTPHEVAELIAAHPLAPDEEVRAVEITRGEYASVHLVQIRGREQPHSHSRYDLFVTIVRGTGTLHLQGARLPLRAGDSAFIPRGAPHFFVNDGKDPAAALVVFAPAFRGPDQVPVREERAR